MAYRWLIEGRGRLQETYNELVLELLEQDLDRNERSVDLSDVDTALPLVAVTSLEYRDVLVVLLEQDVRINDQTPCVDTTPFRSPFRILCSDCSGPLGAPSKAQYVFFSSSWQHLAEHGRVLQRSCHWCFISPIRG